METDRTRWNRKYEGASPSGEASELLSRFVHLAEPGTALDLACGLGRNSFFLAEAGFRVDAVDISDVALATISHPSIRTIRHDLDRYQIKPSAYSLIVDTLFLDRRLYPGIRDGLQPGGLLVFETALIENTHISNPAYKLEPGELPRVFADLEQIHYSEKDGRASLVARKQPPFHNK